MLAYPVPPFSGPVRLVLVYVVVGCSKVADAVDRARELGRRLIGGASW